MQFEGILKLPRAQSRALTTTLHSLLGDTCSALSEPFVLLRLGSLGLPLIPPPRILFFADLGFLRQGYSIVAQTTLKLFILLSQTPECWDYRCES